jgi:hypothetical protein
MSDPIPRPGRRPPVVDDFDPCDRCGVLIREPIPTRLAVHTPDHQYRFGELHLCLSCAAELWRFLDEKLRRDTPPDFVAEAVSPDVVIHPQTRAARQWVEDTVGEDCEPFLLGGVVIPQGTGRTRDLAIYVATHIVADGLRITDVDDCLDD